jgi:hypothetical protein
MDAVLRIHLRRAGYSYHVEQARMTGTTIHIRENLRTRRR